MAPVEQPAARKIPAIPIAQAAMAAAATIIATVVQAKTTIDLPLPGGPETPGQQLQQAVNDPANAGVRIRLARGVYALDPTGPNGGRLLLQPDMEIVGENEYVDCDGDAVWDPVMSCVDPSADPAQYTLEDSETLIDGTAITLGGGAVMLAGRNNSIARVTVRAPRRAAVGGSLDINVANSLAIRAVVRDSIFEGGQRGIRCNNGAPPLSGVTGQATIERNIMRFNTPVPGGLFGFAMQIQNSSASDSVWNVYLRNNRMMGSRFGLFIVANRAQSVQTFVGSRGNLIHDNQAGGMIVAAFAPVGGPSGDSSHDNVFRFDSLSDAFFDNVTPSDNAEPFLSLGGGLMAFAAASDSPTSGSHTGNVLDLHFLHSRFERNYGANGPLHLTLAGYLASPLAGPATGADNVLSLLMRDTMTDDAAGTFIIADEIPATPPASNRVIIIGSDVAFEQTNPSMDAPPSELFPPWE